MAVTVCPILTSGFSVHTNSTNSILFSFFSSWRNKTDQMKGAEASIKVLLDEPSKQTAALIKEAQAEYEGLYSFLYSSM